MRDTSTELIECFADAQLQRHWILPRLRDHELLKQKYKIYHAVDSNVFSLYLDPAQYAVASENQIVGIGAVFRNDELARKQSIAAALAEFIWNGLQSRAPLLLLSPVNQEIERAVKYHVRAFEEHGHAHPAELTKIQERLQNHDHILNEEDLRDLRDAIMLDSGPAAAMRRMRYLFDRQRLRSIDRDLPHPEFDDALRFAVRPASNVGEMFEFAEKKEAWQKRLREVGRTRGTNADHDAETMARLELCNGRLSRAEGGKRLLLYITGDNSLLTAGETYEILGDARPTTFTQQFLRHPRAYLNEPEVLNPSTASDNKPGVSVTLAEWLQVLLGRLDELGEVHIPHVGKIDWSKRATEAINALARTDDQAASKILEEWSKYEAVASLELPNSYLSSLSRAAAEGKESFLDQLQRLRSEIQTKKAAAWEDCFYVSTSARFILQVIGNTGSPAREVPLLCFEGRPKLLSFLKEAKEWFENEDSFSLETYQKHRKAVVEEDTSGYGDYLSHAYLMALQMQWRTASIFAARARERVPAGPPKPSRSNGREALYFEAFCRRYSASSLNDLEGLELLLDEAKKIATAEMKAAQEEGWLFDPVVERFEAEHLALQLSRLLFQWLSSDEPNKVNYLLRMEKMIPVIDRFRSGVDRRIRNLPPEASGDEIRRHIPVFDRKAALENISIRALRNVLAIGLQVPSARTEALKAWTELQSIDPSRASGKQHGSFISEFLYVCSAAHFGDTAQTRRNARRRIEKDFSERAIEKNKTFPYDASRFLSITRQIGSS